MTSPPLTFLPLLHLSSAISLSKKLNLSTTPIAMSAHPHPSPNSFSPPTPTSNSNPPSNHPSSPRPPPILPPAKLNPLLNPSPLPSLTHSNVYPYQPNINSLTHRFQLTSLSSSSSNMMMDHEPLVSSTGPHASPQRYEFGTKTSYPIPDPLQPLIPDSPNKSLSSRPRLIHVSLIARHGTRNPTNNSVERMTSLESWLKSSHPNPPKWLTDWSQILAEYRRAPGALTSHGHHDLYCIGVRFASLYAKSLQQAGATVRIRSSYKERAVSSAEAFRAGYIDACDKSHLLHHITSLKSNELNNINMTTSRRPSTPDLQSYPPELSASPTCSSSSSISASSVSSETESTNSGSSDTDIFEPDTPPERSAATSSDHLAVQVLQLGRDAILRYFEHNVEYANFANQHKALTHKDLSRGSLRRHAADMAVRMSKAFGCPTTMDIDLVRSVSEAAAFETAHGRSSTSIFCKMITPSDVRVLNTFERRHRPFFKAHERFETVSAPLVEDLAQSLMSSVETSHRRRNYNYAADLRFAHAETLVPLLLLLGIRSNGLNPSHPEYRQGLAAMSPFAANLALELYEDNREDGSKFHFVRFRLNERYVERVPALGEHGRTGVVELSHLLAFFNDVSEREN